MTYNDRLPIPAALNPGMTWASRELLLQTLGAPRSSYSDDCQPVTNTAIKRRLVRRAVGHLALYGLDTFVDALADALGAFSADQPAAFAALTSAGIICARYTRGTRLPSPHSWGTAIDLGVNGDLVPLGRREVQRGLALFAPYAAAQGILWGAAWRRADSMHFEASRELLLGQWQAGQHAPAVVRQAVAVHVVGASTIPAYTQDGVTWAPVRSLVEGIGWHVAWNAATEVARVTAAKMPATGPEIDGPAPLVVLPVGPWVDAEMVNGVLHAPVRPIVEACGRALVWDPKRRAVTVR